jgi:hypothetical protein
VLDGKRLVLVLALALAAGCATRVATPYDPGEAAPYAKAGLCSVRGRVVRLEERGSSVALPPVAGAQVLVLPSTRYVREWWDGWVRGARFEKVDERMFASARKATSGPSGDFAIEGLPAPGAYFLAVTAEWDGAELRGFDHFWYNDEAKRAIELSPCTVSRR